MQDVTKHYVLKSETVRALRGVSFVVPEGDYVAIMGPSGSGKSTLLNLLGCLDRPTSGSLFLGDEDVARLNDDDLSRIRATRIGFVFQSYNLFPTMNVLDNVLLAMDVRRTKAVDPVEMASQALIEVGLAHRIKAFPSKLSGGDCRIAF